MNLGEHIQSITHSDSHSLSLTWMVLKTPPLLFFNRIFLILCFSNIYFGLNWGYTFSAGQHRWCLILVTWSRHCLISPLYNFSLHITSKQSVGRHFKTMQISCFSSKCFSRLSNTYYSGCKTMIFQFQFSLNTVGTQHLSTVRPLFSHQLIDLLLFLLIDELSQWTD